MPEQKPWDEGTGGGAISGAGAGGAMDLAMDLVCAVGRIGEFPPDGH